MGVHWVTAQPDPQARRIRAVAAARSICFRTRSLEQKKGEDAISMIVCDVCPRACRLEDGTTGFCGVRVNRDGMNIDMLYRCLYDTQGPYFGGLIAFLPGCNLKCWYCGLPFLWKTPSAKYQHTSESELVSQASSLGCGGICLFGGEPALHHEYILEAARLCRQKGLETILTTNGFIAPWLAQLYGTAIDVPVVGIKGSGSPRLYADMSADPKICLRTAKILWQANKRTQITDLIGPGLKYTEQDDREFAEWICGNISADVSVRLECLKDPASSTDLTIPLRHIGGESDATTRAFETAKRFQDAGLRDVQLPLSMNPQIR